MKTLLAALVMFALTSLRALVPQLLNYQGRVAIGGVNYDGSGRFKFALIAEVPGRGLQSLWSNDPMASPRPAPFMNTPRPASPACTMVPPPCSVF